VRRQGLKGLTTIKAIDDGAGEQYAARDTVQ
jgi:hypothetical protein